MKRAVLEDSQTKLINRDRVHSNVVKYFRFNVYLFPKAASLTDITYQWTHEVVFYWKSSI